jgi:hypothetical protein
MMNLIELLTGPAVGPCEHLQVSLKQNILWQAKWPSLLKKTVLHEDDWVLKLYTHSE